MKPLHVTLIIIGLMAVGCKKDVDHLLTNPTLVTALKIKNGSYWIYRDSVTATMDSAWSTGYATGFSTTDEHNYIEGIIVGIIFHNRPHYSLGASAENPNRIYFQYWHPDSVYHSYIGSGTLMEDPFLVGRSNGFYHGSETYVALHEHFTMNSITYDSVYETAVQSVNMDGDSMVAQHYFSMSDGLIKMRMSVNHQLSVLELVRKQVIR